MEEKIFEFMTKIYSELSEFRKETNQRFGNLEGRMGNLEGKMGNLEGRMDNLEGKMDNLENRQTRLEILIENDIRSDIKALYDGYQMTYEKLCVVEDKVDTLSSKVEKQDVEIRVIKGGKANA